MTRRHARAILATSLFVPWYYEQQSGTSSVQHFLAEGWRDGLLPNPLTDFAATGLSPQQIRDALIDGSAARLPTRLLDVEALVKQAPACVDHPGGPVGFFLEGALAGRAPALLGARAWADFEAHRRRQGSQLRLILDTGVFDREYYESQAGPFPSLRAAVWHFLETGERLGLSPNVRFEAGWYRERADIGKNASAFAHFLRNGLPWADAAPGGDEAAVRATARVYGEQAGQEPPAIDWDAVRSAARVPGLTSVLIPAYLDWKLTASAIRHALDAPDVEVVVVDNGSSREVLGVLTALFSGDPRVHLHRLPVNLNFATGSNVAFARSRGEYVVWLNNDTEPQPGWLPPLLDALRQPGVLGAQPLLLYPDGSIQTAGTVFLGPGSIPGHFLASHPIEDLRPEIDLEFAAVTAACTAMRARDVAEAEGFDPRYVNGMEDVDLCLRLREKHGGHFVTVRDSVVVHHESKTPGRFAHSMPNRLLFLEEWSDRLPRPDTARWEEAGFDVVALLPRKGTQLEPVLKRRSQALRWALKAASSEQAGALAAGLRALGHEVVIDLPGAHTRQSEYLDDVTVDLGVDFEPQPGAVNLVWNGESAEALASLVEPDVER